MLKLKHDEIVRHLDWLIAAYPELADDEILRRDMIEGETDLVTFLRLLEDKRRDASAMTSAIEHTIDNLRSRCVRFERRDEAIRTMMLRLLQHAQLQKMELPEATLSICSAPARVIIHDEADLPEEFWRIKKEPDKTKIKDALVSAAVVPGASLSNSPDTLAIRIK
jgi:Siphovirus Gp157